MGEQCLRDFQDNEKTIPTILTTSQKLSTGVDARNIRNIVLLRPVNSMVGFKQIIGRGTRLFDGKEFFTIYDYVGAYEHFLDSDWDGPPEEPVAKPEPNPYPPSTPPVGPEEPPAPPFEPKPKVKIKLRDGREPGLLELKYRSVHDAADRLSGVPAIRAMFIEFQQHLYPQKERSGQVR